MKFQDLDEALRMPSDTRLFAIGSAMLDHNYSVDRIHSLTKIDKWFLEKLSNIHGVTRQLKSCANIEAIELPLLLSAKKSGFSDIQIASLVKQQPLNGALEVRAVRKLNSITPFVKRIDTLAGEFPAHTNYLYMTYNADSDDLKFDTHGVMVLGK